MEELNVFISHRHDDFEIADVIAKHLKEWGVNEKSIFQSSNPHRGLTPGSLIKEELQKKLTRVNLLLLLYTDPESDWSFCMWECGIAQGKSTVPARTVVFQCSVDEPTVFKDELRVAVSPDEIRRFVKDFHRKPGFVPSLDPNEEPENSLSPDTPDDVIKTRSDRLYSELSEKIPSGTSSSRHMWDFLRLRLDAKYVKEIEVENNNGRDKEKIISIIKENLDLRKPIYSTIGSSVDTALKQFGFAGYQDDMKLKDLIEKWREEDQTSDEVWIDDVYESIYRSLTNSQSIPIRNMMKSVRVGAEWWFLPVVTRMRSYRDNSCEFDLYLVLSNHE